ncbi:hypothetical protein FNV43_RR21930 [Rhamnella rubrinervis]|uniref:LysM domain-containing protein n=1 Tax=Rhamnella rubrinervis TaxID=2594499 RepID=A0A8K0DTB4_9ROSA|nr:hypothetical protein FNV43_RR21930 [Rhamnella rubrinervis]
MGSATVFLGLCLISALAAPSAVAFTCSVRGPCYSLVDYIPPNATTYNAIKTLFGVKKVYNLFGANNLPITTPPNGTVPANQKVRIPFPCLCANGTGLSNRVPNYTVKAGEFLDFIARTIFSALTTYQEIARVNGIPDPSAIEPGQQFWIPIPCSCDEVDGARVVHYGHVVESGSSVEEIAQKYNTTEDTLLKLNGMNSSGDLKASQLLDVPLHACSSSIRNDSFDHSLLLSNGTYALTAHQCVKCRCDAAKNMILQCEPSQLNSTSWNSCPSTQCSNDLYIGNSTSSVSLSSSACNATTCAYRGYNNATIFTSLVTDSSTCQVILKQLIEDH